MNEHRTGLAADPPPIGAGRYIGQRVPRKEDPRLLTGRGQFVDDVVVPRMLHCAFARSSIARGRIVAIVADEARALPGVHAVYTAADPALRRVQMLSLYMRPLEVPTTPLADGRVAYVGDPFAIVVAESRRIAEDAAALVRVDYEEEAPVVTMADARRGPLVHPGAQTNVAAMLGDEAISDALAAVLDGAPHQVTHTLTHQRIVHSPMETRGVVAIPDGPEELTIYIACQSPHLSARWISTALGLDHGAVRVIAKDVGGSFGLKSHPWREEAAVVAAALACGRPLKWIEDRYENLISANQAREQEITVRAAFGADGRLLGSHADCAINNGAYPTVADSNAAVIAFLWAAYRMPAFGFITRGWYTNTVGLAAYRGPWALESLARETALDVAARKIGIDPIELRRRNMITRADLPAVTALGIKVDDIDPAGCLDALLKAFDVPTFRREQAEARKHGRHLGLGVACYVEPTASNGTVNVMTSELAQIRIEPTGKVTAAMSTHSQGHGTPTTMAQLIADRLGVAFEDVTIFEGDSAHGGFGPGAAGSRQAVIGGGAALKAADLLVEKVKGLAAHLLNASPETVRIEGGKIHVEGAPDQTRSLKEIAEVAYGEPARWPLEFVPGLEAQYRYTPPTSTTFASAAHACVVEVDVETGVVKILRWVCSEDCGNIINPAVVEGQIAGGVAQGIGSVLFEEMAFDARGNPTAPTFKDYLLPQISNVPDIEFVHANTPSKSEGGFRGVGEGGAVIGPPTLVNAIADALAPFGEMRFDLPLTPAKLMSVIEGRTI